MSAVDVVSVEEQVRRLGERQAIADLVARLGRMLDDKRFDEAEAILAEQVSVRTPGGTAFGREAVLEQARRNHTVRTQHVITDLLIELEGDRAEASANLIVTFAPDSNDPGARLRIGASESTAARLTIGERYRFEAARGATGWRLTGIEVRRLWSSRPTSPGTPITQIGPESPKPEW